MTELPKIIIDKLIKKAGVWNDEIRPHMLKGLHNGYIMCLKDQAPRTKHLMEALELIVKKLKPISGPNEDIVITDIVNIAEAGLKKYNQ